MSLSYRYILGTHKKVKTGEFLFTCVSKTRIF